MKKADNTLFDFKILPLFIVFSIFFLSIGYASINAIPLDIEGTLTAQAQEGVFISNVNTNGNNDSIISYEGSILHNVTALSKTDGTSKVTYEITVFNNSDKSVGYSDATYGTKFYSNSNIVFEVKDIKKGQLLSPKESLTFNITFYYKDNKLPDTNVENFNILDSYINFEFKELFSVSYDNFNTIPSVKNALSGENLSIQFTSDVTKVEVYSNDTLLTPGTNYTFENNILTVNNVTGKILIKNIKQYTVTFDATGGSSVSSKLVEFGAKYGALPVTEKYHYIFIGWFTSATGGTKITEDTIYNIEGNTTLYAHWGYGYDYQHSSTVSSISVYRDTEVTFDTGENAVKLMPKNTTNDSNSYPSDIGVYLTFSNVDISKYKYVIVGYRVPTSLAYTEETHMFPFTAGTNNQAQPYCTAVGGVTTSDAKLSANIFNFSGNSYFTGQMSKLRLDYYNRCNFQTYPIVPYYLYYLAFAETQSEANEIAEAIRNSK